jgi:Fic family protein
MKYNWQQKEWPKFSYDLSAIEDMLFRFAEESGQVSGLLKAMPEDSQVEAVLNNLVAEAIKTSEIEGEYLSRPDVISSVRNNLGLNKKPDKVNSRMADGIGQLIVTVRNTFNSPLRQSDLLSWHKMLLDSSSKLKAGAWRTHLEPMQVISGPIGKEKVHFEAPPSSRVPDEMKEFLRWFNDTAPGGSKEIKKAPVRSAIAHLYFESIHPFEDGNGRIGRAIAEKALLQTVGRPILISLSQAIEADRRSYYAALENAQRTNDITDWINYFVKTIVSAQGQAKALIEFSLRKSKFFDRYRDEVNARQLKVINKMFDAGPNGFEGGMTAKKYISVTKTSKATATRDLQLLTEMKALFVEAGGRSTRYQLNLL